VSEEKSARELVEQMRQDLQNWGIDRGLGIEQERYAMQRIAEIVKAADGILPVAEMARLSGVSRDTIYAMLKEEES